MAPRRKRQRLLEGPESATSAQGPSTAASEQMATSELTGSEPVAARAAAANSRSTNESSSTLRDGSGQLPLQELRETIKEMVSEAVENAVQGTWLRQERGQEPLMMGEMSREGEETAVFEGTSTNWPVSQSLRQKILSHKYVDMKAMLGAHELPGGMEAERQYLVAEDGKISYKTRRTGVVSVTLWAKAFVRYARVYCSGYPEEAVNMLGYMSTVLSLTDRGLGTAWKDYDESFRQAKELDPAAYPWAKSSSNIWMESVARGLGSTPAGGRQNALPRTSGPVGFRHCFGYNSPQGCQRPSCAYIHHCSRCKGGHPATSCVAAAAGAGRPQQGPLRR